MSSYALWNNKGGVGKSFLGFVAGSEYAHSNPEEDVYIIDMCPQANISETLLGGFEKGSEALEDIMKAKPRATVAGYIEERLNSPFKMIENVDPYVVRPSSYNSHIPDNLYLVCGDNLLEIMAEAIRQTSQLSIPEDAWKKVLSWIEDLKHALENKSDNRDCTFFIDCNPSFSVYTQLGLVAADNLIVPFTADDSSRRAIENVVALMYGTGDKEHSSYARISFHKRAREDGVNIPKLHTFVSNRVTQYKGEASKAFKSVSRTIKETMDGIYRKNKNIFSNKKVSPSETFVEVQDYHQACIVADVKGIPMHQMKAGPQKLHGDRIQLNKEPLDKYREALQDFVKRL